jgi:hypothetical protein
MACGLEIKPGCNVTLEIKGDVKFKGGINEDGIRVHPGAHLTITGAGELYCSGNNEKERIKQFNSPLGLYYGTEGFDPAKPNATQKSQITTPASLEAFEAYTADGVIAGGSGIGYANHQPGTISIIGTGVDAEGSPALKIIAKGFGRGAFGIGGGDYPDADNPNIHIENVHIKEARGGYSTINKINEDGTALIPVVDPEGQLVPADRFIYETKTFPPSHYAGDTTEASSYMAPGTDTKATMETYIQRELVHPYTQTSDIAILPQQGKNEAEGGCAIGVGGDQDAATDHGWIKLENVKIDKAIGGSKAAAIGAYYWSAVKLDIQNSTLHNITGGNAAAAIGGSRFHGQPNPSDTEINIEDTKFYNIQGGQFGAAIGSGYNTYTTNIDAAQNCIINISSSQPNGTVLNEIQGGMAAAGIGTGYHQSRLEGFIDENTAVAAVKAGANWADFDYTAPGYADAYVNKYDGGKYNFAYYADNKYGTLSKVQDIGYGTLYTRGINIDGGTLKGRECVDIDYVRSVGYQTEGISNNDLKSRITADLLADPGTYTTFDSSVSFTIAGEKISNPRELSNLLSRHSSDSPVYWSKLLIEKTDGIGPNNEIVVTNSGGIYNGSATGTLIFEAPSGVDLPEAIEVTASIVGIKENTATGEPFIPGLRVEEEQSGFSSFFDYVPETGVWSATVTSNSTGPYPTFPHLKISAALGEGDSSKTIIYYIPIIDATSLGN